MTSERYIETRARIDGRTTIPGGAEGGPVAPGSRAAPPAVTVSTAGWPFTLRSNLSMRFAADTHRVHFG
jgi:hypothetical protein